LQIAAGLLVIVAGVGVFRGLRRRAPRPGFPFVLARFLRRLAAILILLLGLAIGLEGTPYMTASICLDITEDREWCFGGGYTESDAGDEEALLDSSP
jgi:hypothetical protein